MVKVVHAGLVNFGGMLQGSQNGAMFLQLGLDVVKLTIMFLQLGLMLSNLPLCSFN